MQNASRIALGVTLLVLSGIMAVPAQSLWQGAGGPSVVSAAALGDAKAQTRLGFMLSTGRGFAQNFAEAAYWYRRAAEQGDPDAQYLLGVCHDLGRGVPVDWVQAHKWLNLSAGRTRTGEEREHRARMRDAIASKLSRAELAAAHRLAIAWRPKPER
jgi:TPR repeat protein